MLRILVLLCFVLTSCQPKAQSSSAQSKEQKKTVEKLVLAADRSHIYLPLLEGKNVACVVNQTSTTDNGHLVDYLLSKQVNIKQLLAPEHGIRGKADAGEHIDHSVDSKTGLPIISIYGINKKPSPDQLEGIDVILFDIQDVGARFYTYISTLHYVMEAAAEQDIEVIVLDRPNPNGNRIDGPILRPELQSFVGMHPVPALYGMTIGEYGMMINGEGWLADGQKCKLTVITCDNYDHSTPYDLPVKPSPNLPNAQSIYLYPSLCFLEGTKVSLGRGTNRQFQVYGHPSFTSDFTFTPVANEGAKHPKHKNQTCKGVDLASIQRDRKDIDLTYLLDAYRQSVEAKVDFFIDNNFFDKLAGTYELRKQILAGKNEEEIKQSWIAGLQQFKITRSKYLLYKN